MCGWGDNNTKYYLLGTPIVWWGSTVALGVGLVAFVVYLMRMQRRYVDMEPAEWDQFLYAGKIAFFGWVLHYGSSTLSFASIYVGADARSL